MNNLMINTLAGIVLNQVKELPEEDFLALLTTIRDIINARLSEDEESYITQIKNLPVTVEFKRLLATLLWPNKS